MNKIVENMNNKGFALSTVLIFSVALLILSVSMFFVLNKVTKFSGEYKRFSTIKEAANTGIDLGIDLIENYKSSNSVLGINIARLCDNKTFEQYLLLVSPDDSSCLDDVKKNPWIDITENNINLKVYIIKKYQDIIKGVGGVTKFPPAAGSNVRKYNYFFEIISVAEDSNGQKIVGEALYKFSM